MIIVLIIPILKIEVYVSSRILLGFCATIPHVLLVCSYGFTWSSFTCPTHCHPGTHYQQPFVLVSSIFRRYFKSEQVVTQ